MPPIEQSDDDSDDDFSFARFAAKSRNTTSDVILDLPSPIPTKESSRTVLPLPSFGESESETDDEGEIITRYFTVSHFYSLLNFSARFHLAHISYRRGSEDFDHSSKTHKNITTSADDSSDLDISVPDFSSPILPRETIKIHTQTGLSLFVCLNIQPS